MTNDRRLQHLEKIINGYEEQIQGLERAILQADPGDKVRYRQRMDDVKAELYPYKEEYKKLMDQDASLPLNQEQHPPSLPPASPPQTDLQKSINPPAGAMPLNSAYYVERPSDKTALEVIQREGVTLSITGSERVGKSSLLARVLDVARSKGKEVFLLNFDDLSSKDMQDGSSFYRWFCRQITYYLRIEDKFEEYSEKYKALGDISFCTHYIKNHILSNDKALVIALDSLEKLIDAEFRSEFFGMLRSWHNARAFEPEMMMLDLILVTSINPSELIEDLYQSPFSVGQTIQLKNFTDKELTTLNKLYGSPVEDLKLKELNETPYWWQQELYQIKYSGKNVKYLYQKLETHKDSNPSPDIYKTTGPVETTDKNYVLRQADKKLLDLCQKGEYAYVLTSRQVGKTSLVAHAAKNLPTPIIPVIIDLQGIGATPTQEEWYLGFLLRVVEKLTLQINLFQWWEQNCNLGMTDRFTRFFEEILKLVDKQIVVFVDEIDTTISLDYTDDFFIAIRSFYTERPNNPNFNRLSFVLLGVATPAELIKDENRTPFNIAKEVELTDFTLEESQPLASGLGLGEKENNEIFEVILSWTDGHPYLTQTLCLLVKEKLEEEDSNKDSSVVEIVVNEEFLTDKKSNRDVHFQGIENMLTKRNPDNALGMLNTYDKILKGEKISDETGSEVKRYLKLSGIVKAEGKYLVVRNKIYNDFFDQEWIALSQLLVDRPYANAVASWSQSVKIDQSKLLLFEEYDKGYEWYREQRARTQLSDIDHDFFEDSKQFNKEIQGYLSGFLNDNESKKNIVDEIMEWTNGNQTLNTSIFEQIKQIGESSDKKKKELWRKDPINQTRDLISTNCCKEPENGIFQSSFSTLSTGLEDAAIDYFHLLLTYRGILNEDQYDCNVENADDNNYKKKLKEIHIIIKSGNRLKVANKIYAEMFNQTWVYKELEDSSLRPYGKQFVKWLKSEGRDRRYLLRGTMLAEAKKQFANDRLHRQERQFILDSRFFQ